MRKTLRKPVAAALLLTLFTTACQDAIFAPLAKRDAEIRHFSAIMKAGKNTPENKNRFTCFATLATTDPIGHYYGRIVLHVPMAALSPSGETTRYYYRGYDRAGALVRTATCLIPRTRAAVDFVNKHFHVPEAARIATDTGKENSSGPSTALGTVALDPVTVTVTPVDNAPTTDPYSCTIDGCPPLGPSGGGGDGGGTSGGWSDGGVSGSAFEDGPGAFALCVAAVAALVVPVAALKFYMDDVYEAAGNRDGAYRMLQAGPYDPATYQVMQLRAELADQQYASAVQSLAIVGGTTAVALMAAVAACSPGLLLPTP
jgi:hypothetical protein